MEALGRRVVRVGVGMPRGREGVEAGPENLGGENSLCKDKGMEKNVLYLGNN